MRITLQSVKGKRGEEKRGKIRTSLTCTHTLEVNPAIMIIRDYCAAIWSASVEHSCSEGPKLHIKNFAVTCRETIEPILGKDGGVLPSETMFRR